MQYKCHKMFCRSAFKDFHGPIGSCTKRPRRLSLKTAISRTKYTSDRSLSPKSTFSRTNSSLSVMPSAECIELSILPFRDGLERKFFVDHVVAPAVLSQGFLVVEGDVTVLELYHGRVG